MTLSAKTRFRALVAATIAIYLAFLMITMLRLVPYSHEIEVARSWNHYQAMLPYPVRFGWAWVFTLLQIASLVGLLFFRPIARQISAAILIAVLLTSPFMGLLVLSPLEHFMNSLIGLLICLILGIAFLSPLSAAFEASDRRPSQTES